MLIPYEYLAYNIFRIGVTLAECLVPSLYDHTKSKDIKVATTVIQLIK